MLHNIYLKLIESTDNTDTIIKIDTVPTLIKLNPRLRNFYDYAQVQGDPDTKVYMGIVAQYDCKTAKFSIIESTMRDIYINLSFLKEHAPIIN